MIRNKKIAHKKSDKASCLLERANRQKNRDNVKNWNGNVKVSMNEMWVEVYVRRNWKQQQN